MSNNTTYQGKDTSKAFHIPILRSPRDVQCQVNAQTETKQAARAGSKNDYNNDAASYRIMAMPLNSGPVFFGARRISINGTRSQMLHRFTQYGSPNCSY